LVWIFGGARKLSKAKQFLWYYDFIMAKLTDFDLPVGFETTFFRALTLKILSGVSSVMRRKAGVSFETSKDITGRSLFILWQDLWASFSIQRKSDWALYWATLPFGSHIGAGGWPGSGYSAFVFENAPRFKLGLDLILDPPLGLGPEIVTNPSFALNSNGWILDGAFWSGGNICVPFIGTGYLADITQSFGLILENAFYRVQIVASVPNGIAGEARAPWSGDLSVFYGGINTDTDLIPSLGVAGNSNDNVPTVFSADVNYNNDPVGNGFGIRIVGSFDNGPICFHSVSLKKIL